jgi:hypothetical protein
MELLIPRPGLLPMLTTSLTNQKLVPPTTTTHELAGRRCKSRWNFAISTCLLHQRLRLGQEHISVLSMSMIVVLNFMRGSTPPYFLHIEFELNPLREAVLATKISWNTHKRPQKLSKYCAKQVSRHLKNPEPIVTKKLTVQEPRPHHATGYHNHETRSTITRLVPFVAAASSHRWHGDHGSPSR